MKELNESTKPTLTPAQKSQLLKLEDKFDKLAELSKNNDIHEMVFQGIRSEYSNLVHYYNGKKVTLLHDFSGMYRDFERLGVGRKTRDEFSNLVYEIGDELSDYIKANIGKNK